MRTTALPTPPPPDVQVDSDGLEVTDLQPGRRILRIGGRIVVVDGDGLESTTEEETR